MSPSTVQLRQQPVQPRPLRKLHTLSPAALIHLLMAEQCSRQAVRALKAHITTTAPESHTGTAMVVHVALVFWDSFYPCLALPTPGQPQAAELRDSTDHRMV